MVSCSGSVALPTFQRKSSQNSPSTSDKKEI